MKKKIGKKLVIIGLIVLFIWISLITPNTIASDDDSPNGSEISYITSIPDCECGGCPGGSELINGAWECVCANCIFEKNEQNIIKIKIVHIKPLIQLIREFVDLPKLMHNFVIL